MPRLRETAKPFLTQAAQEGKVSFLLAALNNGRRVELLRIGKIKNSLEAVYEANAEPYAMRTVRVILAWYSTAQLNFFIQRNGLPSKEDWPEANESKSGLTRELQKIHQAGGCCDIHQKRGLTATAVPIFNADKEVVASLGCYSPISSTDYIRQKGLFLLLQELSHKIQTLCLS